jgi:ABC transporter
MPVIEVTDLRKRYRDRVAVQDLSFTVDQGEIFGILGPNGAGKTTTVESIAGLRRPDGVSPAGLVARVSNEQRTGSGPPCPWLTICRPRRAKPPAGRRLNNAPILAPLLWPNRSG